MPRHDDDDDDRDREDEERNRDDEEDAEDDGDSSKKKKKSGGKLTDDDKLWGMLAHLSPLLASFAGLPFLGPLLVMVIYKDKSEFVTKQAKEALNFELTMLIVVLVTCFIGAIIVGPLALIFHIIGGLAANKGEDYRYPMTIRFIK
jgi:uncharacterized Tic20 family protein